MVGYTSRAGPRSQSGEERDLRSGGISFPGEVGVVPEAGSGLSAGEMDRVCSLGDGWGGTQQSTHGVRVAGHLGCVVVPPATRCAEGDSGCPVEDGEGQVTRPCSPHWKHSAFLPFHQVALVWILLKPCQPITYRS